jgi:hypothetical protein
MRTLPSSHSDHHTPRAIAITAAHPANRPADRRLFALSALYLASVWMSLLLSFWLR